MTEADEEAGREPDRIGPETIRKQPMTERVSFRMQPRQLERLDELVESGQYPSRAAALRAGVDLVLEDGGEERC